MLGWLFRPQVSSSTNFGASLQDVRHATETATGPLERRIDSLQLACAGLWVLLKTKHGYTDDQLIEAIRAVDALDGAVDGKINTSQMTCPRCHRKVLTSNRETCSWCGAQMSGSPL